MNIVQLTTELRLAGAERVILELSKGLKARGHQVWVISLMPLPAAATGIVPDLEAAGIAVYALGVTKSAPWRMLGLRALLRRLDPDVVHAHLIHANLVSRLFCGPRNFRLVNSVHIAERRRNKAWHFWLDRLTHSRCDVQTAVSEAVRDFHSARIGLAPERMPVVYNGIVPPRPMTPETQKTLRADWGMSDCNRVIGSVGRLNFQKGYDVMLGLLPELSRRLPADETWGVVIIGEGPSRAELEALVQHLPSNLKVALPGFRQDAADCAGAFDLFVMPSRYEGFGLTLAEAMGHGLPILAADIDSLPELMRHYANGQVIDFSADNQAAVVAALLRWSQAAKTAPTTLFSIDAMVDRYLTVYEH
jgi:glycosyltransferase involved in cell wall biosynthesis